MILVFDVGNTETTVGLFDGSRLHARWGLTTHETRTDDEVGLMLRALLDSVDVPCGAVAGVAIGSVVPAMTPTLTAACARCFSLTPLIVDARSPLPIRLDVEEPLTVGADRLINTLAASRMYGRDTIVVDLGTATTYDCITADGVFLGGIIAPGIRTSADTLYRRTSKLPATELKAPAALIGRRTEECIKSGVIYGAAESINGLVRRLKEEWPGSEVPLVVATGGLAVVLRPHCESFDMVEPELTLHGLRLAYALLAEPAA